MQQNRLKNAGRNALWGMVERVIAIVLPFLVRTVLIHTLSIEYVGVGGLFSSVLQLLSLAEMGIANAIIQSMYKPLSEGDRPAVCALLRFYQRMYRIIGAAIFAAGVCLLPFVEKLVSGPYPPDLRLKAVYLVYLVNTSLSYFVFAYKKSLLIALQRNDLNSRIAAVVKMLGSTVQIALLLLWKNYYLYVLVLPISTLADNLLCAYMAKKRYPEYLCKGELDIDIKQKISQKAKGLVFHRLCGTMRNACDSVFISALLGLATAGMYSNYFYIMSSVRGLLDVLTKAISAGIGNSMAVDPVDRNWNTLNILTFLYEWVCGWCTVCLLCLYQPFMSLWVGQQGMFSFDVVVAFCIYFYIWTMGDIKSQFADARGIWWKNRYRTCTEAVCNFALNWLMIKLWGVTGIVLATAISILFVGFPWSTAILFKDYFCGKSLKQYLYSHLRYAIVTIAACVATWFLCSRISLTGICGLLIRLIICVVVPNSIYFACYHRMKLFVQSIPYIKRLIKR